MVSGEWCQCGVGGGERRSKMEEEIPFHGSRGWVKGRGLMTPCSSNKNNKDKDNNHYWL